MALRRFVIVPTVIVTLTFAASHVGAADPTPAASGTPAADEKIVTTASGLKYIDDVVGVGPTPKKGQTVHCNYSITVDGKRIEGSALASPLAFTLGKDQVLKAIEEGVSTMKVGGKRRLIVPPALGYGVEGVPGRVSPNAILYIELELLLIL
jgi:FKBP-type peptidyl-prolyl cis-trans isomerase